MKNKLWVVVLALSMLLGACGGGGDTMDLTEIYAAVESTDLSTETGGLSDWDVTEREIREQLGEPAMEGTTNRREIVLGYEDYQYVIGKEKLQSYSIQKDGKTERGIGIGDDRNRIEQSYGSGYVEREQDELHILGYSDKENGLILEFVLQGGKAEAVIVMRAGGK